MSLKWNLFTYFFKIKYQVYLKSDMKNNEIIIHNWTLNLHQEHYLIRSLLI